MKYFSVLVAALAPFFLFAQLTIRITALPANTAAQDKFYLAGNFNNWNAGDSAYILTPTGAGQFSITLNPPPGLLEYKITRGSWATVECNASGGFVSNRTLRYDGSPQLVQISIAGWEDRDTGGGGTAAPNVFILDDDFYIPQLRRQRRIWVYLPPDYATSKKRYPVLYLHDGQNVFDAQTSFSGEWQVDESLNSMFNQGDYGCIAVGIDNGGSRRFDEYSPWKNPEYGGGEGALYIEFIANTLKPHIDSTYRTLPACETTGIMGSSMGGLISAFAVAERPEVFCKAGVFSPAFWVAGKAAAEKAQARPKRHPTKVYFLAGGSEPAYVESDMVEVGEAMLKAGFMPADLFFTVPPDGQHNELFWRREFPAAYRWLFAGATPASGKRRDVQFGQAIEQKDSGAYVELAGIPAKERIEVKIVGSNGAVLRRIKQRGGRLPTDQLPDGEYSVWIKRKRKDWVISAFKKE